jgi:hypothetical protein
MIHNGGTERYFFDADVDVDIFTILSIYAPISIQHDDGSEGIRRDGASCSHNEISGFIHIQVPKS